MTSSTILIGPTAIPRIWCFQPSVDVFNISEALFDAACPIDSHVLGEVGAVLMRILLDISGIETIEIKGHSLLLIQKTLEANWDELKQLVISELKGVFGEQIEAVAIEETVANS